MLVRIKVFPGSKKEEIIKRSENSFEVRVKEKPVGGLANKAVINVLSSYFRIPAEKVKLIKGSKERNKIFEVSFFNLT